MRAIIVAAGMGKRLEPLTKNTPKPLLRIKDGTILEHQLQNLKSCGITDTVIVVGYLAERIKQVGGPNIKYIYNPDYETTNSLVSLWYAREEMNNGFTYLHADVIFHPGILLELLKVQEDICLVVEKKKCIAEDMKVKMKNGLITEINKTMPLTEAYGEFIGLAKFSTGGALALREALDTLVVNGGSEVWFESSIQWLADKSYPVYELDTGAKPWLEIDFPEDLDEARNKIYPMINNK